MHDKTPVATALKKIKIDFDAIDVAHDLAVRAFLDCLKVSDLPILEEILHSSVRTTIDELLESLDLKRSELEGPLRTFEAVGLLKVEGDLVTVSKEVRRSVDLHFERTDEDFAPDIDFALSLMRILPVQQVPLWYALPKTSTSLREALLEKFFLTPALYGRHLETSQFDDRPAQQVLEQITNGPIDCRSLGLESQELHRLALVLELNFIAFLTYRHEGDELIPIFSPLREYSEYLERVAEGSLFPKADPQPKPRRCGPFAFLRDLDAFVDAATQAKAPEDDLSSIKRTLDIDDQDDLERLKDRALRLRLVEVADGEFIAGANLEKWRKLSEDDRPFCYLRHPALAYSADEKSVRAAEKSIALLFGKGWASFDDFMKAALIPLREEIEVRLKGRGRSCHYAFPEYTEEERELVHHVIFTGLAESGFVETAGEYFRLTDFGALVFGPQE